MTEGKTSFAELNERSRDILRAIVENYVETGEPTGSRTIARRAAIGLSAASVRNVMADLEDAGLLYAPHTSAGRLPTDDGMRLFVHGLLEVGRLTEEEQGGIESQCASAGLDAEKVVEQAVQSLSGLSRHTGLVIAPKTESPLKHIEFVRLSAQRALVVMVAENGVVENRIIDLPLGVPTSALVEAGNYLNARLVGRNIAEGRRAIQEELKQHRAQLDALAGNLVEEGLAIWGGDTEGTASGSLIVRGQSRLLEDVKAVEDLDRVKHLLETLETKETMLRLLDLAHEADGVQIFIGAESDLFSHAGCSMIISPYKDSEQQVVGAVGVIGPLRMNYARIIPMVDYTAQVIGRLLG